jgi:prolyl oligopeptidase
MKNLCVFIALATLSATAFGAPPSTPKRPVTDTYHGVKVVDDYRWLQNWNDPEVKQWSDAENAFARQYLDHLSDVPALRRRVTQIMEAKTISYGGVVYRKGKLFALKREPPKQQPMLIVLPSSDAVDQARVLVDPNTMDAKGSTVIDWFVPSADCGLVAVSLSHGGTESGDVHLFDVATGKPTGEVVPRVNSGTAGGRPRFLPAGLFPQAGHADGHRPVRIGPGLSPRCRITNRSRRSHGLRAGHDAIRRRRRVRTFRAAAGGRVEADHSLQGRHRPDRLWA